MVEINNPGILTYWIVYNEDKSILHYGKVEAYQQMTSGLDYLESFIDEQLLKNRLSELGITYVDPSAPPVPPMPPTP